MFEKLTKKSVEQDIIGIRDIVNQALKNSEKKKIKEVMGVIKKIIKEDIEAIYKFYSLLLLKEIMAHKKDYVIDYFFSKLSDRLAKISLYRHKKNESIEKRGETCLNE